MAKPSTFHIHDTTFHIWDDANRDNCKSLFKAMMGVLRHEGFAVKKRESFRFLATHGDLQCDVWTAPIHLKFEFFQDVVHENPHGGLYDFNKLAKMPYLIKLRYQKTVAALKAAALERGVVDDDGEKPTTADEHVMKRRRKTAAWHKCVFDESLRESYNVKDRDGVVMHDGDWRYYIGRDGRIRRGRVYYSLNNNWHVVYNQTSWTCDSSCRFFATPLPNMKGRIIDDNHRRRRLRDELDKAVAVMNFERAIILRDKMAEQSI